MKVRVAFILVIFCPTILSLTSHFTAGTQEELPEEPEQQQRGKQSQVEKTQLSDVMGEGMHLVISF